MAAPHALEIRNPTNPDELFSEAWSDSMTYLAFTQFIRGFLAEIVALRGTKGIDAISGLLDRMFGDDLGKRAVHGYTARLAQAKADGAVRFSAPGIIVGAAAESRASPRHIFHHGAG